MANMRLVDRPSEVPCWIVGSLIFVLICGTENILVQFCLSNFFLHLFET
jgi:hypothetical protein